MTVKLGMSSHGEIAEPDTVEEWYELELARSDTVTAHEDDDAAAADKFAGAVVYVLVGRIGFIAPGSSSKCGACTILHGVFGW